MEARLRVGIDPFSRPSSQHQPFMQAPPMDMVHRPRSGTLERWVVSLLAVLVLLFALADGTPVVATGNADLASAVQGCVSDSPVGRWAIPPPLSGQLAPPAGIAQVLGAGKDRGPGFASRVRASVRAVYAACVQRTSLVQEFPRAVRVGRLLFPFHHFW
jgi:hypothetical protein